MHPQSVLSTTAALRVPVATWRAGRRHHRAVFACALLLPLAGACRKSDTGGVADTSAVVPAAPGHAANSPGSVAAPDRVPAPIAALGHHAEDVYDMAKSGNWTAARASTDSLRAAVAVIPDTGAAAGSAASRRERAHLTRTLAALDHAVTAHDSTAALRAANRLTELGARLSGPYDPRVPSDVTLLDYYGRELELWSAANEVSKLRATAAAMHKTWVALRPRVESHGGSAEAARFDALVARADSARTASAYAAVAKPILDEVDKLEAVFNR